MLRQSGLALLLCAGLGTAAPVQADGTPSAFDTVFSPVSYRTYYSGYTPYYAGYTGYYGVPYSSGYAPGVGCGCQQASYSAMSCGGYGCSPCGGGCATGNCASGNCATGGCATTTNLAPSGSIAPVPDPTINSNTTKTFESRLEAVERALNINPNNTNPRRTFDDGFGRPANRGNTGFTDEDPAAIPARPRRNPAAGSGTNDNFEAPENRSNGTMFEENRTNRVNLGTPNDGHSEEVIPTKKPAPGPPIDDKSTMRMDSRVTSRAVSPRERTSMPAGANVQPKVIVRSPRLPINKVELDAGPRTLDLVRN